MMNESVMPTGIITSSNNHASAIEKVAEIPLKSVLYPRMIKLPIQDRESDCSASEGAN